MIALLDAVPSVGPHQLRPGPHPRHEGQALSRQGGIHQGHRPWKRRCGSATPYKYFDQNSLSTSFIIWPSFCAPGRHQQQSPAVQDEYSAGISYFKRLGSMKPRSPRPSDGHLRLHPLLQGRLESREDDTAMLKVAQGEVQKGLISAVHPKDSFYALLLSILQQQMTLSTPPRSSSCSFKQKIPRKLHLARANGALP